jgi:hypothetical protein
MATNRDNFILKKIDDLDPATSINEEDVLIFEQAGVAKKATVSQFRQSNTLATDTDAGTVKTNTTDTDPIVYLKSEVDALFPPPVSKGGTGASSASGARTNLGLGSIATQDSSAVSISGGSITGITDLTVADGGTGASSASAARSNLGAASSGANSDITSITGLTTALSIGQGGTGATTQSAAQTNLGLVPSTAQYNASQIQSKAVSSTAPTNGQALVYASASSQYVPRAAGKVLQMVTINTSVLVQNTTTLYASTGLSASITPQFATSSIFILATIAGIYRQANSSGVHIKLRRNTNDISFQYLIGYLSSPSIESMSTTALSHVDTPNTTSTLTYNVDFALASGTGTVSVQNNVSNSSLVLMEIAA